MNRYHTVIGLSVALLLGNATILLGPSSWDPLRLGAALGLTFVLPGWAWLPVLRWTHTRQALERITLIVGLSSIFTALALTLIVFLPSPFTELPVLVALNLITISGLVAQFFLLKIGSDSRPAGPGSALEWPSRTVLIILALIIAVAAFTRLTRMGYAEFHEDELENMRLIVRAYKGEEFAPFLDSKGPIHWLLPAALWYLNGWVNEGIARTPFAITGLFLIPLMFSLGRRISGRDQVGLLAAGFVALNGFYVAYSRHVENQSLIVFWGALAMWFAYRYHREQRSEFLLQVALALSVGLIAHPDVLLYLPVFGYLIVISLWQQRSQSPAGLRKQGAWLIGSGLAFTIISAIFYIPYLFDPQIGQVYQYFAGDRIGQSLLYNRVPNLFDQDQLYSSRYHAPVLVLLLLWFLARQFGPWRWPGLALLATLSIVIVASVLQPELLLFGEINLAFGPYALLTGLFLFLPRTDLPTKTIFLWFIAPMGALLFLAKDAADHIQIAYTGWALISALALADLWDVIGQPNPAQTERAIQTQQALGLTATSLRPRGPAPVLRAGLIGLFATVVGLIIFYQYLAFSTTVTAYWDLKAETDRNPDSIYNRLYGGIPRPRKIFSNPRLSGWKAVGYLWSTGQLSGDFRSINESFAVPIWYTFQTPRSCYEDPQNYWVRRDWRGWPENGWPEEEADLLAQGYRLTRIVLVDQAPKLHLFEKGRAVDAPEIIDSESLRRQFDRLATPARYAAVSTGQVQTHLNFGGDRLRLQGYDLPAGSLKPTDLLPVSVYWEALAPMKVRYRAFVHLVAADGTLWGQHDDDPACRLLTSDMRPGQGSSRQFRIPISPDTPLGEYHVVLGLYDPDTLVRLEIWDDTAKQNIGDSVVLGTISIN